MFSQVFLEKFFEAKQLMESLPQDVRELVMLDLLRSHSIDYTTLSKQYVQVLEEENKDRLNLIIEAETCIAEHVIAKGKGNKPYKPKSKTEDNTIQRSLYFLNQGHRLNMQSLNEKFGYNAEEAKELSWYERNKERGGYNG